MRRISCNLAEFSRLKNSKPGEVERGLAEDRGELCENVLSVPDVFFMVSL